MATNKPIHIQQKNCDFKPAENGYKWEVIYVKPKCEKKLAKYALERDIYYFLPLKDSERKYKYRTVKFTKPLMNGYIFVKCNPEKKRELIRSGYTLTFLKVHNEKELLEDLKNLYDSTILNLKLREIPYLEKGTKVIIKQGTFKGLKGFVEKDKNDKIILKVHLLKKAFSVEINHNDIEIKK